MSFFVPSVEQISITLQFSDPLQPWSSGNLISTFHNFLQPQSSEKIPYAAQDCLSARVNRLVPSMRPSLLLSSSVLCYSFSVQSVSYSPFLPPFISLIAKRSTNLREKEFQRNLDHSFCLKMLLRERALRL